MKSFTVILVVTISLCGLFMHSANCLSCYQCSWTDATCATEKIDSKLKKVDCAPAPGGNTPAPSGPSVPPAPGGPSVPPAPGGPSVPPAPGGPPAPPAPEESSVPPAPEESSPPPPEPAALKNKKPFLSMADPAYYCFKVNVKANSSATPAVERGCKMTNKVDDCIVIDKAAYATAVAENCMVCNKDNCNGNGQSMVTGSVVQCALISSLVVARMFFQTK